MKILEAYSDFTSHYLEVRQYSPTTINGYWWVIKSFLDYAGNIQTTHITQRLLEEWINFSHDKGNTQSTIATNISRMRVFVDYLYMNNLCELRKEVLVVPRIPKRIPSYTTPAMVDRLIHFAPSLRDKVIIAVFFSSGIRNMELRNLLKCDYQDKTLIIKQGKGMRDRICYIDDRAKILLDRYLQSRVDISPFLFVTKNNTQIASSTLRYIISRCTDHAGLEHIHPHMFRHGLATHLMKEGMPSRMIQKLLGHQNLATTEMYMHVTDKELSNNYDKIMKTQ